MMTFLGRKTLSFMRLLALPLFSLLLFLFYFRLKESPSTPQTIAGLIFNTLCATSVISVALTSSTFAIHRLRFYQESWDNLYGGTTFILSQLLTPFIFDIIMLFGSGAIVFWSTDLGSSLVEYAIFSGVLWCSFQFSQLQTMCLMLFMRSAYKAACVSSTLIFIYLTWSTSILKSLKTFIEPPKNPSDWLYYLSYGSMYRFASATLQYQHISNATTGCNRIPIGNGPEFCRWTTGEDYLSQMYPEGVLDNFWTNFGVCFGYIATFSILTIVLYSIPMPYIVKRKFRYK